MPSSLSFLLLWIAREYYHLAPGLIRSLIFVKLAVAGHMTTIYLARTRKQHFWEQPLSAITLFTATECTAVFGTLRAVLGIFMTPVGLYLAALVWAYALFFFVTNDLVKVKLFLKLHPYS